MQFYNWIIQNKELLKIIYALLIGLICLKIVIKTDRLFRLSLHQGIRYFRNAFFFYGLAFATRYLLEIIFPNISYYYLIQIFFEFFLIMAGFSLLYSLLWKKFEIEENKNYSISSLFNIKIIIFYVLAIIISLLDYLWNTYCFMFFLQIIVFVSASILSYKKYMKSKGHYNFLKLYFIIIVLNLFAWILNFIVAIYFGWNLIVVINIYILNTIIFFLFSYCVSKVIKKIN